MTFCLSVCRVSCLRACPALPVALCPRRNTKRKVEIDAARTRRRLHAKSFQHPASTQHAAKSIAGHEVHRRPTSGCQPSDAQGWRTCPVRRSWAVSVALRRVYVPRCPVGWRQMPIAGHATLALGRQSSGPEAGVPTRAWAGGCTYVHADAGLRGQVRARAARTPRGLPDQNLVRCPARAMVVPGCCPTGHHGRNRVVLAVEQSA